MRKVKTTFFSLLFIYLLCFSVSATSNIIFDEDFNSYNENTAFSKSTTNGIGPWNVNSSLFTGKIATYTSGKGKSLQVSPPATGGTDSSILWFENLAQFGSDATNSPLRSGTIVLQNEYRFDTAMDDTMQCSVQVSMWDNSWKFFYFIKGSKIYDVFGSNPSTAVLAESYPIAEWFTIRTTIYADINGYDVDLIRADGSVVRLKHLGYYSLPTGGIKKVRFRTSYHSTTPTCRTPVYYDNVLFTQETPEQPPAPPKSNTAEITSNKYPINHETKNITRVLEGTTISAFLSSVTPAFGATVKVYDELGVNQVLWGEVKDGMKLTVVSQDRAVSNTFTIHTKALTLFAIEDALDKRSISTIVANDTDSLQEYSMMLARYDVNHKLIDITMAEKSLPVGENAMLQLSNIPTFKTERMKLFLWNAVSGMKPTTEVVEISPSGNTNIPVKEGLFFTRPDEEKILADLVKQNPNKAHPRLYARSEDIVRIREAIETDRLMKSWYISVKSIADDALSKPPYAWELRDGIRLLYVSNDVTSRINALVMAYQIEQDPIYAQRAYQELKAVGEFPDWNPSHFLDVGQMMYAYAIGYDWIYDYMDQEQRSIVRNAMIRLGFDQFVIAYENFDSDKVLVPGKDAGWWTKSTGNWNSWCNSGAALAALAIADEEPELAGYILEHALRSLELFLPTYGPDGGYVEGIGYGAAAVGHIAKLTSGMDSALGTDYGYFNVPGIADFAYFLNYMNGPVISFNFHDAGADNRAYLPESFFVANKIHNAAIGRMRKADIENKNTNGNMFDMIWYKPENYGDSTEALPLDRYFRNIETGSFRSSWEDPNAMWLGFHGGDNSVGHAHLDSGTFVFDAMGLNWALDLGSEPLTYTGTPEQRGDPYLLYRFAPQGHNTLQVNINAEHGQKLKSVSPIIDFASQPSGAFAKLDITAAYGHVSNSAIRGYALTDNRTKIVIQDEIELKEKSDVWWSMHTRATIEVSDDGKAAILSQKGKRMRASLVSPSDAEFLSMKAEPLPGSPTNKYQVVNEGIQKLAIKVADVNETEIMVEFIPINSDDDLNKPVGTFVPLENWGIHY